MSTAVQTPAGGKTTPLADVLADALGVLWGAVMLGVLALWLSKFEPPVLPPPAPGTPAPTPISPPAAFVVWTLWALSAAGLLLSVWVYVSMRKLMLAGDGAGLLRFRQLLGLILIVGGLILAVLGLYLVVTLRLAGFGESVGLCLFALIPLLGGLNLQKKPGSGDLVSFTMPHSQVLAILLFVAGGAGILTFLYLTVPIFKVKVGSDWMPELGALVFESLLCITAAIWLITSQPLERTPLAIRCVLMVLGGVTGLILTLEAFFRTILWRQDVLLGGMGAWLGPNSWRFWLCAYIGLVGLALIFGSMLLARSEVRTQPRLRQALYGFNMAASGLLLLAFLGTLNVLSNAMFPMTFEWSERGLIALSPASMTLLDMLKTKPPVTVYVMLPQNSGPLYNDMKNLLDNCVAAAPFDKLIVKYVSPTADENIYNDLTERFPEIGTELSVTGIRRELSGQVKGRGVLLVQGKLPSDASARPQPKHSFIPDRKLMVPSPQGDKRVFMGEVEIMRDLKFLLGGQEQHKVYILQGDNELDVTSSDPRDPFGGGVLADRLEKDNYKVEGLDFNVQTKPRDPKSAIKVEVVREEGPDKRKDVPKDAWALIVPGPEKLTKETLDALERYMDRGGKMLVTLDLRPTPDKTQYRRSGIADVLKKYGVAADEGFVVSAEGSPFVVVASTPRKTTNELALPFINQGFRFEGVRVVRPLTVGKFKGETLLEADADFGRGNGPYIVLNDFRGLRNRVALFNRIAREPLPVAVAVSQSATKPEDPSQPRLVVIGNTDFIGNMSLFFQDRSSYALLIGALEWMGEKQPLPIGPKTSTIFSLPPTAEVARMVMVPLWLMSLGILGLGTGVWLVRRR